MESSSERFDGTWIKTTAALTDADVISKWRAIIKEMYGEAQRHYHTMTHVEEMLGLQEQYADRVAHESIVAYSIIFHDVVYDPKAKDNEEESAELFKQFAKDAALEEDFTETVVAYILATKLHMAPLTPCKTRYFSTVDLNLFLDFDMAVLGRSSEGYGKYAAEIRKEYIHVPSETFNSGRTKVLQSMLEMPHIYATEAFRDLYEQKARQNITAEIKHLRKPDSNKF